MSERHDYAHDPAVLEKVERDPIADSTEAMRVLVLQGQQAYDEHVARRRRAAAAAQDL